MSRRSILSKPPRGRRNIANATGAVLTNGGQIKIPLNKDFLVADHAVNVAVSQTWGTNAPSSSDVRRFFSRLELTSNEGTIYSADFHQVYDQARFTELASSPVVALGAGGGAAATATFGFNLHHVNDEATLDLLTALQTANFSTLELVLTVAPDASNGFIGGTGTVGAAAYTVAVDACEYPGLSGRSAEERKGIAYGKARHSFKQMQEKTGVNAASNQELLLETGNKTRFLFLHSYNTTAAIPVLANGIVDKISLSIGGQDYMGTVAFRDLQQENIGQRGFNQTGVAVLDMGDDPAGWIPLENVNEAKLRYSTLGTAPATWKVTVGQDMSNNLAAAGFIE